MIVKIFFNKKNDIFFIKPLAIACYLCYTTLEEKNIKIGVFPVWDIRVVTWDEY